MQLGKVKLYSAASHKQITNYIYRLSSAEPWLQSKPVLTDFGLQPYSRK